MRLHLFLKQIGLIVIGRNESDYREKNVSVEAIIHGYQILVLLLLFSTYKLD